MTSVCWRLPLLLAAALRGVSAEAGSRGLKRQTAAEDYWRQSTSACSLGSDGVLLTLTEEFVEEQLLAGIDRGAVAQAFFDAWGDLDESERLSIFTYVATLALRISDDKILQLLADSRVAQVEANCFINANISISSVQSNPPTWGTDRVDVEGRNNEYNYGSADGDGTLIYILDTGIRVSHVDFGGRAEGGFSAGNGDGWVEDGVINDGNLQQDDGKCSTHGTHTAGTAGGTDYGIAKKATIISVQVLNCYGTGSVANIMDGIEWAVRDAIAKGKKAVISMSLGMEGTSLALSTICFAAAADGDVVVVVAAGNDDKDACEYSPANSLVSLTVGATTKDDKKAGFSNYGECVDIWAPGVDIKSASDASDTSATSLQGTSMACPHVAGAAAALRGLYPQLTAIQTRVALLCIADADVIDGSEAEVYNNLMLLTGESFSTQVAADCVVLATQQELPPFVPPAPSPPPSPPLSPGSDDGLSTGAIVGIVIGSVFGAMLLCACAAAMTRRARSAAKDTPAEPASKGPAAE